jgi:hypothetical protein
MRPLALTIVSAGGRGRAALVVAATALTSGLLLVAVSIVRLWEAGVGPYGAYEPREPIFAPIADPGTRPGAVLAVVLLTVPVLLLLDQAVRLGSPGQHRRYTALSVAGATRRDLRRWAAVEVGGPALVGALLGIPVWLLLRQVLGHGLAQETGALVPTATGPGAWSIAVILVVTAYGAFVGRRAGASATAVVQRGGERRPPRPWPALLVLAGILVFAGYFGGSIENLAVTMTGLLLVVAGAIGLAPWAAHGAGWAASRRARSARMLLAGRRLQVDPRPAGRAAAAVGAVGLTMGVLGVFVADILAQREDYSVDDYLVPALVVGICALLAVAMIGVSLAIHAVETTLERRREMAALVATGVPVSTVSAAQRIECLLTTLPLTVVGATLGALGYGQLVGAVPLAYVGGTITVALTACVVAGSVYVATMLVRPWLHAAVEPANLRTE